MTRIGLPSRIGPVDVLISNAGYGVEGTVEESSMEDLRRQFDVNVFGTVAAIKAILSSMRRRRSGHTVTVSSIGDPARAAKALLAVLDAGNPRTTWSWALTPRPRSNRAGRPERRHRGLGRPECFHRLPLTHPTPPHSAAHRAAADTRRRTMSDTPSTVPTAVDFWFDPVCPWTWLTSRWMFEVRKTRPVEITWHVMSLAVLNERRLDQLPSANRELMGQAWAPVRVLIAAQEAYGPGVLEPLYTALGTRYHPQGLPKNRATIEAALREAGLPEHLAEAGDTDTYDSVLRRSHQEGITLVGQEVGSPIIAVPAPEGDDKIAFFGPVVTPTPRGEQAARLWDGTLAVASTPGFYEIKRTRTVGPIFD